MNTPQEKIPVPPGTQASARPGNMQEVDWRDFRDHIATAD